MILENSINYSMVPKFHITIDINISEKKFIKLQEIISINIKHNKYC